MPLALHVKKLAFGFTTLILTALLVEASAFLAFRYLREDFTFFEIDQYLLTDTTIRYAHQSYHADRGWDTRYKTPFGERPRGHSYGRAALATFGDSHTFCEQVLDHESWQEYLSAELGQEVYNFGTGGYGTDQAFLKFREKFALVETPVVVLGLVAENINRLVNVYRPFYYIKTGQRVTKPRFRLVDGKLELVPNPVPAEEFLSRLRDPSFIEKIGRDDYWYNRNDYPVFRFPYSRILVNKRMWTEFFYYKLGYAIDDLNPRPWENLWKNPDATDLMFAIFDSFVEEAEAADSIPVILIIPVKKELRAKIHNEVDADGPTRILEYCKRMNYRCFYPIDGFVEHVERGESIKSLYSGHLSPAGNRLIAQKLGAYLIEIEALPGNP